MQNSLSPAFVKINYSSAFGPHTMTLPSVPVISGAYEPTGYAFQLRGLAVPVPVDDAVTDFVNVIRELFPATVTFQDAIVYSQPTPEDIPLPVASFTLGIAGAESTAGNTKAVEQIYTLRADDFGLFKLSFLDCASYDSWDAIRTLSGHAKHAAVVDYVTDEVTWLAARSGGRPNTFLQITVNHNEKLRRAYRMN